MNLYTVCTYLSIYLPIYLQVYFRNKNMRFNFKLWVKDFDIFYLKFKFNEK